MATMWKCVQFLPSRVLYSKVKSFYFENGNATARLCSSSVAAAPQVVETSVSTESAEEFKTPDVSGLMLFFDDPKNWGVNNVKVGRSWRMEELRIKSNSDLHKLWYVLLKERNMLLTMERNCEKESELFANPERLDKVENSMENLEEVVRERNKAYYELETKETGEAPTFDYLTPHGKLLSREKKEYPIPKHQNEEWQKEQIEVGHKEIAWFNTLWRELRNKNNTRVSNRNKRLIATYLRKFPNVDVGYLKELYPDINIDKIQYRVKNS